MRVTLFILAIIIFFFCTTQSYAESSYVLPYPGTMPGNLSYKVHQVYEKILSYWYIGDLSQFEYNLKLSDKYLVEAKILFEYKQYLLGAQALEKSNVYFKNTRPYLMKAKSAGKDIANKIHIYNEASIKHVEILNFLLTITPSRFLWKPEKGEETQLSLNDLIKQSIEIREN